MKKSKINNNGRRVMCISISPETEQQMDFILNHMISKYGVDIYSKSSIVRVSIRKLYNDISNSQTFNNDSTCEEVKHDN